MGGPGIVADTASTTHVRGVVPEVHFRRSSCGNRVPPIRPVHIPGEGLILEICLAGTAAAVAILGIGEEGQKSHRMVTVLKCAKDFLA